MGITLCNLTQEQLCDLMCGSAEKEFVDGYEYAIGDIVELKEQINDSYYAEIVSIDPKRYNPYQICQEYSDCDDVVFSWITEDEIKGLMR